MGLISGLGEGVIWLIQYNLVGVSPSSIYIDVDGDDGAWDFWGGLVGTAVGATAGALAIAFTVGTGGIGRTCFRSWSSACWRSSRTYCRNRSSRFYRRYV